MKGLAMSLSSIDALDRSTALARLESYCQNFQLTVTADQLNLCLDHLDLVIEKNKVLNLTRITNYDSALILHILDSLLFLPAVSLAPEGSLLDIGSGAGFPGIPLHIASTRPTVLIDSVGKKVNALASFAETLHLPAITAIHDRIEHHALEHRSSYAVVTARAVASLPILIEYAAPLLAQHGLLVVSKGNPSNDELRSGEAAAKICGMKLIASTSYDLPLDAGHRVVLSYERCRKSSIKLPRAIGVAKKSPLA